MRRSSRCRLQEIWWVGILWRDCDGMSLVLGIKHVSFQILRMQFKIMLVAYFYFLKFVLNQCEIKETSYITCPANEYCENLGYFKFLWI